MTSPQRHGADEFEIISFVDNGNGSKLYDVVQKQRNRKFSMEVIPRQKNIDVTVNPKLTKHGRVPCKFLVELKYSFQTKNRNYFILTHTNKTTSLVKMLQHYKVLSDAETRFIITELIVVIEKLHSFGIVYGSVTKEDIFFDQTGHILLKRTFCGQTYWTNAECPNCVNKMCSNLYHNDVKVSSKEIHQDWNSIGRLFTTLLTGEENELHLKKISGVVVDFNMQLSNQVQINTSNIKNHPFLNCVDWNQVEGKKCIVPARIEQFIYSPTVPQCIPILNDNIQNYKTKELDHSKTELFRRKYSETFADHLLGESQKFVSVHPYTRSRANTHSPLSSSDALVAGVRKHRATKSEQQTSIHIEINKLLNKSEKRCSSCTYSATEKRHTKTDNIDAFLQAFGTKSTTFKVPKIPHENISRKKSIDIYTKRLEEISKVLENNKHITENVESNNFDITRPTNSSMSSENVSLVCSNEADEVGMNTKKIAAQIYSENECIRTILSKYGLLEGKEASCSTPNNEERKPNQINIPLHTDNREKEQITRNYVRTVLLKDDQKNSDKTNKKTSKNPQGDTETRQTPDVSAHNKTPFSTFESKQNNVNNNFIIVSGPAMNKIVTESVMNEVIENTTECIDRHNAISDGKVQQEEDSKHNLVDNEEPSKERMEVTITSREEAGQENDDNTEKEEEETAVNLASAKNMTELISKLHNLNRRRRARINSTNRPNLTKRHVSDLTQSMSPLAEKIRERERAKILSIELSRSSTAPQSRQYVKRSNPTNQFPLSVQVQPVSMPDSDETKPIRQQPSLKVTNSYDSGLHEVHESHDAVEDDVFTCNIERSDSGVVMRESVEPVRVWKPGNPDENFLHQEEMKIKAAEFTCCDCGKDNLNDKSQDLLDNVCKQCQKSRVERKEAIVELIETEVNYGQDLRILKEEFCVPLKKSSVCTQDEINKIFLNLQELVDVNAKVCGALQDGLETCFDQDDYDYVRLAVGEVFLSNVEFFEAYEVYCSKHQEALELLQNLQKKSELLRIFLSVSSKENSKLRKMDLKSFLTMPIQRIMKYPLLLLRIYKHTPSKCDDKQVIRIALKTIEDQIAKINHISANNLGTRMKKSGSVSSLQNINPTNTLYLSRLASNMLDWKHEETLVLFQDDLEIAIDDLVSLTRWNKKSLKKLVNAQVLLCVNGASDNYQQASNQTNATEAEHMVCDAKDAVVILLKKKSADKCVIYRQPINLKHCIMTTNPYIPTAFELSERDEDPIIFIAQNTSACKVWKNSINFVIHSLNIKWRKRRRGLCNIMISMLH